MRKKYSDPLMFPALLSSVTPVRPSQNTVIGGGDDEWDESNSVEGVLMNSAPTQPASEPLTIVNPVEEALTSTEVITEEPSGAASAAASSPLEAATVIDEIVPDEAASVGVTE